MSSDDTHIPCIVLHGAVSLLPLDAVRTQQGLQAVIHGEAWLETGLEGGVKFFAVGQEVMDLKQYLHEDGKEKITNEFTITSIDYTALIAKTDLNRTTGEG